MAKADLKVGDRVGYWNRRVGERAVFRTGIIRELSPRKNIARVELAAPPGCMISEFVVESYRLTKL